MERKWLTRRLLSIESKELYEDMRTIVPLQIVEKGFHVRLLAVFHRCGVLKVLECPERRQVISKFFQFARYALPIHGANLRK